MNRRDRAALAAYVVLFAATMMMLAGFGIAAYLTAHDCANLRECLR